MLETYESEIANLLNYPLTIHVYAASTSPRPYDISTMYSQGRNEAAELALMGGYSGIKTKMCYGPAMFVGKDGKPLLIEDLRLFLNLLTALTPIHSAGHGREVMK